MIDSCSNICKLILFYVFHSSFSQYPRPPGLSEPSTPLKQDTTPTKVVFRTPRSFTPDLSKKHLSVGMLPSWDERDDKDTSVNSALNASSASIVVSHTFNNGWIA